MKFIYKDYTLLLEALLRNHLPVVFPDRFKYNAPSFIMRHDIDRGLEFLGVIPRIEHELNIKATYFVQVSSDFYNPFTPNQAKEIESLLSLGHCLGLHFDCFKYGYEMPPDSIDSEIQMEMDLLNRCFGQVDAVSFHQPSKAIIDNSIKISYVNTYDRADMKGYVYFSDSTQVWSKGNPVLFIEDNPEQSFQVLVHPFLWSATGNGFAELALNAICDKAQRMYDYDRNFGRGIRDNLKFIFVKEG